MSDNPLPPRAPPHLHPTNVVQAYLQKRRAGAATAGACQRVAGDPHPAVDLPKNPPRLLLDGKRDARQHLREGADIIM